MTDMMTGKQRLEAATRGDPVDRVPIWLREGFPIGERYPDPDHFTLGWLDDPLYRDLYADVAPHADPIVGWGLGGWMNRHLLISPRRVHRELTQVNDDLIRVDGTIDTVDGPLTFIDEIRRGAATTWLVKPPAENLDDLRKLAETPWDFEPDDLLPYIGTPPAEGQAPEPRPMGLSGLGTGTDYQTAYAYLGDRGIMRLGFSSPIVIISGCLPFEQFLELTVTENAFYHELLTEITRRTLCLIDAVFAHNDIDTTVNFGGSEQCTPPMMSPRAFDEFVVPYDGPLVRRLKEYGALVHFHVHGRVRHALRCLVDMGVDSTDPVEPPPAGDVTYAEAREIVGDDLTLVGNLEWDELAYGEPEQIRQRVREILAMGNRRLILGSSAGPISQITPRIAANYRAWVETALRYG